MSKSKTSDFVTIALAILIIILSVQKCEAQVWPASTVLIFRDSVKLQRYTAKQLFTTGPKEHLIVLEVEPGTTYKITPIAYDTIYTLTESIEPDNATRVQHVNMITFANTPKAGISNKSFSAVSDLSKISSSSITFNGSLVEFNSERYTGHGLITVWIDGALITTINQGVAPFVTDLSRGVPSFKKKLAKGTHSISIRGAVNQQHIVDFFSVYDYTLKPRL